MAREADGTRRGDADAQPGERAGADRHRDPVEALEALLGLRHDAIEQRHQRFGLPALHEERLQRERLAGIFVEDAGGDRIEGRIDREDSGHSAAFLSALDGLHRLHRGHEMAQQILLFRAAASLSRTGNPSTSPSSPDTPCRHGSRGT